MGEICLGLGASHSPILFVSPEKWLARVHQGTSSVHEPESFRLTEDNIARSKSQVAHCLEGYAMVRSLLMEKRPDVLIIVGDDQGENFTSALMPQIAVYTGAEATASFSLGGRLPPEEEEDSRRVTVNCDAELSSLLVEELIHGGMEVAISQDLPGGVLGHAHAWPLRHLTPDLDIPVLPIFVNAYFPPQITAERCYRLGGLLAQAIARSDKRVAVMGSGGLSHFPRHLGAWGIPPYPVEKRWHIDEEFDRWSLSCLVQGRGEELSSLTNEQLHESGNLELRNWMALAGALGPRQGRLITYEPVYTVAIGLAVAVWT